MNLSDLGKKVRELRKERGLSQESLCKKIGISRATLSKLENGYLANVSISVLDNTLSNLGYELDIKPNNPFSS